MNKIEILKLKYDIYKRIYTAMIFNNPNIINEELNKLEAQIEILKEGD